MIEVKPLFTLLGIFLLSTSLFLYEILITRLFSTMLLNQLVFFTISLAILGIGIGGFIVYRSKLKIDYERISLLLGISYFTVIVTIYRLPYIGISLIYALLAGIPFVIGGIILSSVFLINKDISNKLYFADLLGSTLGSILIIPLMDNLGFMKAAFVIIALGLVSSLSFSISKKHIQNMLLGTISLVVVMLLLLQGSFLQEFENAFTAYFTSPNNVISYLSDHGDSKPEVPYTNWDSISRTDVVEQSENVKIISTDGGASAPMIRFDGNLESIAYLKNEINFLPFSIGDNESTLLLGSGGGKDILFALLGGSTDIDAVELNPATLDAANEFREFNGDIYNYEGVNAYLDEGRNFIENIEKEYNNIYMAMVMTNTVNNSGLNMSENYIYTEEAYKTYFDHLKDDGYLSFMFHGTTDMYKGINTGIEALLDRGVNRKDIPNYFIVINNTTKNEDVEQEEPVDMPMVVFKK